MPHQPSGSSSPATPSEAVLRLLCECREYVTLTYGRYAYSHQSGSAAAEPQPRVVAGARRVADPAGRVGVGCRRGRLRAETAARAHTTSAIPSKICSNGLRARFRSQRLTSPERQLGPTRRESPRDGCQEISGVVALTISTVATFPAIGPSVTDARSNFGDWSPPLYRHDRIGAQIARSSDQTVALITPQHQHARQRFRFPRHQANSSPDVRRISPIARAT